MRVTLHAMSGALLLCMLSACQSSQIPLSIRTRNTDLYKVDPKEVVPKLLSELSVGMCEHEVFAILNITHETPNISNLSVEELYQHVSLLNGRSVPPSRCVQTHDAEVPYVGHRLPFTDIASSGYLKGIKWVRTSRGADWYVDLLFFQGSFLSYSIGGEKHRDVRHSVYPWEVPFGDPYRDIGRSLIK